MTEQQYRRMCELVGDALDLPSGERTAFVTKAAADDPVVGDEALRIIREEKDVPLEFPRPVFISASPESKPDGESTPAFAAGARVAGRYRIDRWIDAGGMGEVYEAWDERLNRRIALKTILPEIAGDSRMMQRFEREVATAREVTHPNVCRVFDIGEHAGSGGGPPTVFLTMEYLDGETLAQRIDRCSPMTAEAALPLVRQMVGALGAAHRVGVVHRDFKPGNVMLTSEPGGGERAVVTDFGLARSMQQPSESTQPRAQTGLTQSGYVVGTPGYMPPEQWNSNGVGPAADVYALGVVMYQMRTGQKLVWPWPADVAMEAPWARVIERCLDRDPRTRPLPVSEVVQSLEVVEALDEPAPPVPVEPPGPPRRTWRWWAAASALIIFVSVALFAAYFRFTVREAKNGTAGRNVAVLAFRAGEPDLEVFTLGLMEAITQRLSQYEGTNQTLVVTPASEIRRGNVKSAGDAKAKLGANLAVEGTLHSQDGRLRLVMAVTDTATLRQVESVIVEGSRAKALSLQDEAVSKLVRALDLRVQPAFAAELGRLSPVVPGAFEFYLQAKGYLQRNDKLEDIDAAIALFNHTLAQRPDDALSYAGRSEAFLAKFRRTLSTEALDTAYASAKRALDLNPGPIEVQIVMGRILNARGEPREALPYFEKALSISGRSGEALEGLGEAYEALKNSEGAEATYIKMVTLRRGDWRAYDRLARFYQNRDQPGDIERAIERYGQVTQLTPNNARAYTNLGSCYYEKGQLAKAEQAWSTAVSLERTAGALANLAKLRLDQGKFDLAIEGSEAAVRLSNQDYRLWNNLTAAYRRAGLEEKAHGAELQAARLAEELLKRNPRHFGALTHLAYDRAFHGHSGEALAYLRRAEEMGTADRHNSIRLAEIYAKVGQKDQALKLTNIALNLGYPLSAVRSNTALQPIVPMLVP